jgi:hypothetical protein
MLTLSFCSLSTSSPDPKRQEVGTDPSTTSTGTVTIAVAGTAQSTGVSPLPAMSNVVEVPWALRVKKAVMKKSSL